jgi:ligand-binding sensor domain-containing protein
LARGRAGIAGADSGSDTVAQHLAEDGLGYLWIGSNRGLMRMKKTAIRRSTNLPELANESVQTGFEKSRQDD